MLRNVHLMFICMQARGGGCFCDGLVAGKTRCIDRGITKDVIDYDTNRERREMSWNAVCMGYAVFGR